MENLAGNKDCDRYIREELEVANIEIIEGKRSTSEVPTSLTGRLGPFKLTRAWYYWVVEGPVPLKVAKAIQRDPAGRYIRVAGMSGGDAPERWLKMVSIDGHKHKCVTSYHIDTEVGLRIFADTVKKYKLDKIRNWSE